MVTEGARGEEIPCKYFNEWNKSIKKGTEFLTDQMAGVGFDYQPD